MKKQKKGLKTNVIFILDKSGSMESVRRSTIEGFNEYLNGLKKNGKNVEFSLTLFDTESIESPYINVPVRQVEPLSNNTYVPMGGTPLYDAVVNTVEKVFEDGVVKKANIVVIMTDGEENSSKEHNEECLKDLKERLEKLGNWTFVFMGANQDAWDTASQWGFSKGNTMNWDASDAGTMSAYRSFANATANFSASNARGVVNTANFFSEEEKNVA